MKLIRLLLPFALAAGCRTAPPPMESAAAPPQDRTADQLQADLEFTERQITELYGPLSFMVLEGRLSIIGFLKVLGRDYVFPQDGSPIQGEDRKKWLFWAENDLFPRNEKLRHLIKAKAHLIEGTRIPPTFTLLLEHQQSWSMLHLYWKKERAEYPLHAQTSWPGLFNRDVLDGYAKLKKRHTALLKELTRVGKRTAEIRFVERQLRELYGPLVGLNADGTVAHDNFLRGLGRAEVFPKDGNPTDAELKKWIFWFEHDILPRNEKRRALLLSGMLFLDGTVLPKSHLDFMGHHRNWVLEYKLSSKDRAGYSWRPRTPFPEPFVEDVAASYAKLKARHAELLGRTP